MRCLREDCTAMSRYIGGTGRSAQRGSEIVEFAITSVLVFVLLFGIIELSLALFDKATITNASREGAREGILFSFVDERALSGDFAFDNGVIAEAVADHLRSFLINLKVGPTTVSAETLVPCAHSGDPAAGDTSCNCGQAVNVCVSRYDGDHDGDGDVDADDSDDTWNSGDQLYVTVAYDYHILVLSGLARLLPGDAPLGDGLPQSSTTVMRGE